MYDDIAYLVEGKIATGDEAFHPGMTINSSLDEGSQSQSSPSTPVRRSPRRIANSDSSPVCRFSLSKCRRILIDLKSKTNDSSSSPVRGKKRSATTPLTNTHRKGRKRNADVGADMASALDRVATSLQVVGSPEVCAQAIQLMEDDGDFSENEGANVMMLFVEKSAYAKAYVTLRVKERRTAFINRMLQSTES